jgi:hypothetical protein
VNKQVISKEGLMAQKALLWPNPWNTLGEAAILTVEAQAVIALRLAYFAFGGERAQSEAARMVIEKGTTLVAAQAAAAAVLPLGGIMLATDSAMAAYRRSVRANYNRLSRLGGSTKRAAGL